MSISIISILEHSLRDKTDNPSAIASAMLSGCPIIAASPGNGGYAYCVVLVDLRRYAITTIKCGKASPAELEGMAGCGVVLSSDCGGISRCVRFNGDAGAKEIMSYLGRKLERARTLTALIQGLGGLAPEGNTLVMQPAYAGAFVRAYASPDKAVIISNYLGRAVLLRASAGEVNKYALALDSYLAQGALKRMGITTCISRAVELYMCVRGGGRCAAAPCQGEGDEDLKGALRAIASGEVGAVIKLFGIAIADFTSRRHLITGRLTRWSKHMDAYADLLRVARDLLRQYGDKAEGLYLAIKSASPLDTIIKNAKKLSSSIGDASAINDILAKLQDPQLKRAWRLARAAAAEAEWDLEVPDTLRAAVESRDHRYAIYVETRNYSDIIKLALRELLT